MRKLIIVPYEMYMADKAKISKIAPDEQRLDEIMHDKTMDISARKVLYDQELENTIKHRREAAEKPMRVSIVDRPAPIPEDYVPTIRMKPPTPFSERSGNFYRRRDWENDEAIPQHAPSPRRPLGASASNPNLHVVFDPATQTGMAFEADDEPMEEFDLGPTRPENNFDEPTPLRRPDFNPRVRETRKRMNKNQDIKFEAEKIYKEMLKDPVSYGITEKGEIINPTFNNKHAHSKPEDAKKVIEVLLGSTTPYSPAGAKVFRKRIKDLPDIKERIASFKSGQVGTGRFMFKPTLWRN